jgi:hypothetical protein
MISLRSSTLLTLLGASLSTASVISPAAVAGGEKHGDCTTVDFHISATANNNIFTNPPDPNNTTQILQFLDDAVSPTGTAISGTQPISGAFTIHGVYCKPTKKVKKHADTLQLLVHGVTYNGTM